MPAALPIETARLCLRPLEAGDLDALHVYHQLEEVARYQYWSERSREELTAKLAEWAKMNDNDNEDGKLCLGVVRKEDGQLIGDLFLGITDREARQAAIGYSFNPAFHRRGYGSEAVIALIGYAFNALGMHRVHAGCDARNTASFKLMEHMGMRREAHYREHALFKGEWDEEYHYAILEDEWRQKYGQAD